ncbi:unnamed protein product, partial [Rotaria magnacalcarata]
MSDTSILNNIDDSREPFCLSAIDIKELSARLQVNESIIICNANRLRVTFDAFYMKTCRFRDAEPCPSIQGLFCNDESPKARYSMVPCGTAN